jgi:hypothetical protein
MSDEQAAAPQDDDRHTENEFRRRWFPRSREIPLPVTGSDFIKPLTRLQLMGRR